MRHLTFTLTSMLLSLLLLNFVVNPSFAATELTRDFDSPAQQQLYQELINELRCPKCQNQTIADSNAPLAKDLRDRTYEMVKSGQSKQQILDFMVARYGDFVHYQPPFRLSTSILWLGPLLAIVLGIITIIWMVRRPRYQVSLSATERERLASLKDDPLERQSDALKQGPKHDK